MRPDDPAALAGSNSEPRRGERRLADSRAELESLLRRGPHDFPRSRTMRFLLGPGGVALATGALAGLLVVKPQFATALMRILPLRRIARRLL